ncbi:MAG: hypothetical protein ISS70_08280 [Phycisphaerae bacterium]|nr:hypothetical protein [Phycisphaerae bacterium]
MRRRVWMRIWLIFFIIWGILVALIGFPYYSSRSTADLALHFLSDHEPWHRGASDGAWGKQVVTVYCFFGYHDVVSHAASKELLGMGYLEISPAIDYGSGKYRFNPRHRRVTTEFRKDGILTSVSIRIGKGRFLNERPDGNLSFSMELDWINVVVRQTRSPFSLRRVLRYYSNKLSRRGARQLRTPKRP